MQAGLSWVESCQNWGKSFSLQACPRPSEGVWIGGKIPLAISGLVSSVNNGIQAWGTLILLRLSERKLMVGAV